MIDLRWLRENPDAFDRALARRGQAQAAAAGDADFVKANAEEIFNDGHSFVGGNPEGSLTLVEFIDYKCGYCRKAHTDVAELVKSDGDIRYVVKEFPILTEESLIAARFAVAALQVAGPEAYQKINAGFYESFRGDVTNDTLSAFATGLGIDPAPIMAAMSSPEVEKVIAANHALAQRLMAARGGSVISNWPSSTRGCGFLKVRRSSVKVSGSSTTARACSDTSCTSVPTMRLVSSPRIRRTVMVPVATAGSCRGIPDICDGSGMAGCAAATPIPRPPGLKTGNIRALKRASDIPASVTSLPGRRSCSGPA